MAKLNSYIGSRGFRISRELTSSIETIAGDASDGGQSDSLLTMFTHRGRVTQTFLSKLDQLKFRWFKFMKSIVSVANATRKIMRNTCIFMRYTVNVYDSWVHKVKESKGNRVKPQKLPSHCPILIPDIYACSTFQGGYSEHFHFVSYFLNSDQLNHHWDYGICT